MKTVFSNREVCHVWASRNQATGRGSNISFDGDVIKSYGWWEMARWINDNTILMRDWSYSSTTGKHMSYLHRAIPAGVNVIRCSDPGNLHSSILDAIKEFTALPDEFKRSLKYKSSILSRSFRTIQLINVLIDLYNADHDVNFQLDNPLKMAKIEVARIDNNPAYIAEAAAQDAKLIADKDAKEAKIKLLVEQYQPMYDEYIKQAIPAWRNHQSTEMLDEMKQISGAIHKLDRYHSFESMWTRHNAYCRLSTDLTQVETSLGARVPVREAKILLSRIREGKDVKGFQIGYYTVISLNGTLKIGCHEITREEIEYFGVLLDRV
jgi:hypothetical protein